MGMRLRCESAPSVACQVSLAHGTAAMWRSQIRARIVPDQPYGLPDRHTAPWPTRIREGERSGRTDQDRDPPLSTPSRRWSPE
eukprot:11074343-Alexandrium_andersonii.AAC.1